MPRVDHIAGRSIRGEFYKPACGRCDALPWDATPEICACSFILDPWEPAPIAADGMADIFNREADERLQRALFSE